MQAGMRLEALAYLACPNCGASLSLVSLGQLEDGHVLEGELVCHSAKCRFPVTRGVPVLVPAKADRLRDETAARFSEEWTRWTELRDYYERQFLAWIEPVTREDFAGQIVFEGGCGKGRHTDLAARFGAKAVVSVDLGESAFVAFRNTRQLANAHVVIGDLMSPPVLPVFDLAFSIGVIHHMPDPAAGAARVASVVREGGRLVYWVYGRENNEWITRFVDPIRKAITSKIPYRVLQPLSALPAAALWAAIRLLYRGRHAGSPPKRLPYASYLHSMRDFPFDELHIIVFDQLVTPVAFYLPKSEVEAWFTGPGFAEVQLRWHNQMSWTATARVVGKAPADPSAPKDLKPLSSHGISKS
jgi:SAM-dependent methyltransferase